MDCASAQTAFWFASIFTGYAAKNREPTHHPKHSENALTTNQKLDTLTSVLNPQGLEPSHVSG